MKQKEIWVIDFGSQYSHLILRVLRELGYFSLLITPEEAFARVENDLPAALILSGGPASIRHDQRDFAAFFQQEKLPVLGICYGVQIIVQHFGGVVQSLEQGEYGAAKVHWKNAKQWNTSYNHFLTWMSHGDSIEKMPQDFDIILESENHIVAGIQHRERPLVGLQFHPEVQHTEHGRELLSYFLKQVAKIEPNWDNRSLVDIAKKCFAHVQKDEHVLCAFSGGVDSLVAASVAHEVLGDRLHCVFVDNGVLRIQDRKHIKNLQKNTNLPITIVDAQEIFLSQLAEVKDPEKKRKIIGKTFIDVFEEQVGIIEEREGYHFKYLLQGTLYPDVIESISPHKKGGESKTIKSHHNVGGLPERMKLSLVEPLRFLYKDEVRKMGESLNLDREWLYRHPFPGPGLAVRILGEVTPERVERLQLADEILFHSLKEDGYYAQTWQALVVLLPIKAVGVKGDNRAYEEVMAIRMVDSVDGMTAKASEFPWDFLRKVSTKIANEVPGVARVVYDLTSKPPGTIEWE